MDWIGFLVCVMIGLCVCNPVFNYLLCVSLFYALSFFVSMVYSEFSANYNVGLFNVSLNNGYETASVDLDRPTWPMPFSRSQDSRSTTPAVIVDVGIGRPVHMTVHCRRPSVSRRRGTNIEQFAS